MAKSKVADELARKLPDLELRQLTEEEAAGAGEAVSVIVELDLPPQKIASGRSSSSRASHGFVTKKVVEESAARQKENARKIQEAREFLETLVGAAPHWLNAARAFVVNATPEQLREMSRSPLMKTIRLNRRLQR